MNQDVERTRISYAPRNEVNKTTNYNNANRIPTSSHSSQIQYNLNLKSTPTAITTTKSRYSNSYKEPVDNAGYAAKYDENKTSRFKTVAASRTPISRETITELEKGTRGFGQLNNRLVD